MLVQLVRVNARKVGHIHLPGAGKVPESVKIPTFEIVVPCENS